MKSSFRRKQFGASAEGTAMEQRRPLCARYLLAGCCFIALIFNAEAEVAANGKQAWTGCAARDISIVIRGCTSIVDGRGATKTMLIQAYLNRGKALAKRGDFVQAIADFNQVIHLSPNDADAYRERGHGYSEQNDATRAAADIGAALRLSPNDAKTYAVRGWFYKSNGDNERAKADFDQAVNLANKAIAARQDLASAHYARAEAFAGLGDYDRAISDDDEAIRLRPEDETLYADRGITYELKGNNERALTDFNKALDLQPGYWHALNGRADIYIKKKEYGHAVADCDLATKLSKDNAAAYSLRGYANRSKGDYDHAIADINEAIRLNPNFADAFANRGWAYSYKKDFERAIADFDMAITLNKNGVNYYNGRGYAYREKGDNDRAISDFDEAIGLSPNFTDALDNRGWAYARKEDYGRAIADFTRVIELNPSSDHYVERGEIYQKAGENAKALADFNEAVRLNPDNWLAYSARRSVYFRQGATESQIADLKEILRLRPDDDTNRLLLAQAYDKKGEHDRAIAMLDKLLAERPDNFDAYHYRGQIYISTHEFDAAIADANQLIRLKPDKGDGYHLRALAYVNKKDFDHAIADLSQAIRADPDRADIYMSRAAIYDLKGDYEHAIADVSEAIKLPMGTPSNQSFANASPDYRKVYIKLLQGQYTQRATYRANLGDFENAIADCNEAVRLWPDGSDGYRGRGLIYYWQKQYDLALQDFDKALRLDPNGDSRFLKAIALIHLSRIDEATTEVNIGLTSGANRDLFLTARGEIAYAQSKYAQAVDDYSEAMKASQFNFPLQFTYRAAAYEKLGQKALAMGDYKAAIELDAPNPAQRDARILARERLGVLQGETLSTQQMAQPQHRPADPGRRIALVIGVSAYKSAEHLPNPVHDADAMAKAFRGLGFTEVTEVRDPDRPTLEKAIKAFGDETGQADWAVVFYAGHGMAVDGRTFLLPTDAELDIDRHVEFETVSLDRVLDSVADAKKLALVILDACRNNPFLNRMRQSGRTARALGQGLASIEPQRGEFVVYATRDGSTAEDGKGDHSPFTQALLMHIGEAGVDIRLMFSEVRDTVLKTTQNRQSPFTYGSLPGEAFYFKMAEQ
jgi:tetratricopeptide (TPR) repeat protein